MPFTPETAAMAGRKKAGKCKDPGSARNRQLKINVTGADKDFITASAAAAGMSITDYIIAATKAYGIKK